MTKTTIVFTSDDAPDNGATATLTLTYDGGEDNG